MMSKDTDDIKLIKKAIRGNSTAYGYLIEKHRTYLYKMAFLYTKNEQDALDVVGDTVLDVYKRQGQSHLFCQYFQFLPHTSLTQKQHTKRKWQLLFQTPDSIQEKYRIFFFLQP